MLDEEELQFHTPQGGLTASIRNAQSEGISQREAMGEARELGLTFSDTTFRQLWHHVENTIIGREASLNVQYNQPPPPELIQETEWGKPDTYYTWLRMQSRIVGTGDIMEQFLVVDTPEPVSPDEAIAELLNRFAEAEQPNETGQGLRTLGFDVWGFSYVPLRS